MNYVTMIDWRFHAWPMDAQKLTQQLNLTIFDYEKLAKDG